MQLDDPYRRFGMRKRDERPMRRETERISHWPLLSWVSVNKYSELCEHVIDYRMVMFPDGCDDLPLGDCVGSMSTIDNQKFRTRRSSAASCKLRV